MKGSILKKWFKCDFEKWGKKWANGHKTDVPCLCQTCDLCIPPSKKTTITGWNRLPGMLMHQMCYGDRYIPLCKSQHHLILDPEHSVCQLWMVHEEIKRIYQAIRKEQAKTKQLQEARKRDLKLKKKAQRDAVKLQITLQHDIQSLEKESL